MFTRVIDKKALNVIVLSVLSFYGTVIPLVLTTMKDPTAAAALPGAGPGTDQCLSSTECAMASSALTEATWRGGSSCIGRNMTVAGILATMNY
eukprot:SAG22_NODE_1571_length_4095_cov_2.849099_5_plen_93_part_00